ncbi:MAG TPA: hypothetical protein VKZ53_02805 [Candidatus Angelobacter sp.]|nr:hypothetical protein [Candidatus Angelobacter sp.]
MIVGFGHLHRMHYKNLSLTISLAIAVGLFETTISVGQTLAHPQILTVEDCGKPLSSTIGNPQGLHRVNVDLEEYRKNDAARMVKALTTLCRTSAFDREIVNGRIDSMRLVYA